MKYKTMNMKAKNLKIQLILFPILLLVGTILSCSKEKVDETLVGVYILQKTGIVKEGIFIESDKNDENYEEIQSELTLLADKSFRIVSTVDGRSSVSIGTYNEQTMQFSMQDENGIHSSFDFYFDGQFLVIVTEENDFDSNVAYYLKK
ncbi:hypothetical protein [Sphingobacterium paludis]|nr:hypothetical protein [Sphingobacterium paludis]